MGNSRQRKRTEAEEEKDQRRRNSGNFPADEIFAGEELIS